MIIGCGLHRGGEGTQEPSNLTLLLPLTDRESLLRVKSLRGGFDSLALLHLGLVPLMAPCMTSHAFDHQAEGSRATVLGNFLVALENLLVVTEQSPRDHSQFHNTLFMVARLRPR